MQVGAAALITIFAAGWAQDGPETVLGEAKRFRQRTLVTGLADPWELTWGPDNHLWVTERSGKRITRVDPATGKRAVAATIDEVVAPGGQEGLLGMALHPLLLKNKNQDYVYVAYTYHDHAAGPDPTVKDPRSPYRFLYMKVVRLTYDAARGVLTNPVDLLTRLPAGNDHNAGRLKFGPDGKLYLTLGDQGHNQFGNFCLLIESQRLPTKQEVRARNYAAYAGKTLRINLDGSIPRDNPVLAGVVSHVYTYGHRNTQGIDFGPDGTLYASEHGPKTDDEVNILKPGGNYGWPYVAGFKDDKAYVYARWADSSTPCSRLEFSDYDVPPSVPTQPESAFAEPFVEPIATLFTVPTGFRFQDPACRGVDFICWPTVGASSIEYYAAGKDGIPGWDQVLLVTALKRGSLYIVPLRPGGQSVAGRISRYFHTENRYRDTAVSPDRRTIYIATDRHGIAEALTGGPTSTMQDPGAILAFTYEGEGAPPPRRTISKSGDAPPAVGLDTAPSPTAPVTAGLAPQFTAQQVAAGKLAYTSSCAVCHGSTLTNGAFATPLAGAYFRKKWGGKSVSAFYEKSRAMPPSAPASLPDQVYAEIVAYILSVNGYAPGDTPLQPGQPALEKMFLGTVAAR